MKHNYTETSINKQVVQEYMIDDSDFYADLEKYFWLKEGMYA